MTICTAETQTGRPCRAHAMRGTEPPLCVVHRQAAASRSPDPPLDREEETGHGFCAADYTVAEIADLVANAADDTLEDEITAVRIATRHVMKRFSQKLDPAEFRQLTRLLFTGANTLARLLRTQRALSDESDAGLADAISQALDELSQELGVEL
jgi:hypothetical protein